MNVNVRKRTPSPKTVTFDTSPPVTIDLNVKKRFKNHWEWERYLNALLADLQNTIPGSGINSSGYGSLNSTRSAKYSPTSESPALHTDSYQGKAGSFNRSKPGLNQSPTIAQSTPYGESTRKPAVYNNNLKELDNLLQDLSSSRYANVSADNGLNSSLNSSYNGSVGSPVGHSRPSSAQSNRSMTNRPSVDSLLDSLDDAGEVIYAGPQKVTITVKETKTETGLGYPQNKAPAASKATRELEELMATLSTSSTKQTIAPRIIPTKASQSHASPKQNLDHMLGNLQADMSRQGVNTSQKGCCNACDKPIVGQVITALGKTWHPEHFTCAHCSQELGTRNFFERDGKPFCEIDYHNLFSPRCAYCNGPILDKCVTALEKTWHMEHFFCAQCGKQFGEEGFHEREGKPYCREDYFDMFAPKCGACNRPIMENYISALNSQWHPDCFVCRDCKKAVQGTTFYAMEGKPVCPTCIGADEEEDE